MANEDFALDAIMYNTMFAPSIFAAVVFMMVIVVWAYHHIPVDASNHYAPEPSVVFPTVISLSLMPAL